MSDRGARGRGVDERRKTQATAPHGGYQGVDVGGLQTSRERQREVPDDLPNVPIQGRKAVKECMSFSWWSSGPEHGRDVAPVAGYVDIVSIRDSWDVLNLATADA